ncbi:tyrosine-type recombinase/integrase [Companilactobacillus sp. DQM5]|uniref:tyrosine-type recombinase/integrase n=1 Tax=Companilactobacillus sp. DQM5 TaxID=3463359 RepID=UPI0040597EF8
MSTHGFRHTHAILLYDENPDITIKDVQKRLGHLDVSITMNIYEHVTDKSDDKILNALNNF